MGNTVRERERRGGDRLKDREEKGNGEVYGERCNGNRVGERQMGELGDRLKGREKTRQQEKGGERKGE